MNSAAPSRKLGEPPRGFRSELRGFGAVGLLAMGAILLGAAISPLVSAPLILIWVFWSHTPWRDIGYVRPENWASTTAIAMVAGVFFKLALKAIIMPLLGAAPVNAAYHYLAHNPAALPLMTFYIVAGAGFAEETFFRGYLFERFGKLFGSSGTAKATTVLLTSVLFGIVHLQGQGVDGVTQATIVGLVFGSVFAVKGRLFPLMIAHTTFDVTALVLIYFDIESKVAHVFAR